MEYGLLFPTAQSYSIFGLSLIDGINSVFKNLLDFIRSRVHGNIRLRNNRMRSPGVLGNKFTDTLRVGVGVRLKHEAIRFAAVRENNFNIAVPAQAHLRLLVLGFWKDGPSLRDRKLGEFFVEPLRSLVLFELFQRLSKSRHVEDLPVGSLTVRDGSMRVDYADAVVGGGRSPLLSQLSMQTGLTRNPAYLIFLA